MGYFQEMKIVFDLLSQKVTTGCSMYDKFLQCFIILKLFLSNNRRIYLKKFVVILVYSVTLL